MAAVPFLVLSKSTNKRRALLVNTLGTLMMSLYYMAVRKSLFIVLETTIDDYSRAKSLLLPFL